MPTNNQLLQKLNSNKQYLGNYYYLFLLQYYSGCRITEALSISVTDISSEGLVLIKGLKGSNDRVITVTELQPLFTKSLRNGIDPFYSMNRFTAYRLLKNIGVQKLKSNRKRESVTHVFRDEHSKSIRKIAGSKSVLAAALGHKNEKNTDYYGKD